MEQVDFESSFYLFICFNKLNIYNVNVLENDHIQFVFDRETEKKPNL